MANIQRKTTGDHICVLTFDRPNSSANIFDQETLLELQKEIEDAKLDHPKGLVFISAKESIFIAGADLKAFAKLRDEEVRGYIELGQSVFNTIAHLNIPTVAAIHGACVGGGYELCLACDFRIATADRATKIGLPEVNLGILPAWGGSTRLPRLIGLPGALDVILAGKTLAARPALKRGMIDQIAPREYLLQAALRAVHHGKRHHFGRRLRHSPMVNRVTALAISKFVDAKIGGRGKLYPAVVKAREVVTRGAMEMQLSESFAREADAVVELSKTEACRNLVKLFFLQEASRKLMWPAGQKLPPRKMARGAVIGAGVMGASIAQWMSARGMRVVLRDIDPGRVAAGMERITQLFSTGYRRHALTFVEARDGMDRILPTAADFPMKGLEIVIEAAVEKLDLKKKVFAGLDEQAPAEAILATNTSALSISEIAAATSRPERVIGIHFFNPVHKMQLVEVVIGKQTSPEVVQRALRFVQQIGKLPVVVQDSPGFLVNRILLPYLMEAVCLFEAGAEVQAIDKAMLEFGMPMGPLRLIDEVGADIAVDVAATLADKFRDRFKTTAALPKMVEAGLLGRKAGAGFYLYKHGKREPVPNPRTASYRNGVSAATLTPPELQRRMTLLMVNEAARCLEEKIVGSAADVDFGMVMGTGFAPFRGGPLSYADSVGLSKIVEDMKSLMQADGAEFTPCLMLAEMAAMKKTFYGTGERINDRNQNTNATTGSS